MRESVFLSLGDNGDANTTAVALFSAAMRIAASAAKPFLIVSAHVAMARMFIKMRSLPLSQST